MEPLSLWEVMEGMGILEVIGWGGLKVLGVSRPENSGTSKPGAMVDDVLLLVEELETGRFWDAADAAVARLLIAMAIPRAMLLIGQLLTGGWRSSLATFSYSRVKVHAQRLS